MCDTFEIAADPFSSSPSSFHETFDAASSSSSSSSSSSDVDVDVDVDADPYYAAGLSSSSLSLMQAFLDGTARSVFEEAESSVPPSLSPSPSPSRKRKAMDLGRVTTNVKRVVQELNHAETAEDVQHFINTVMHVVAGAVSPRVATLMLGALPAPVACPQPPPPAEPDFQDERDEVVERLYGHKARKLDLLVRRWFETCGDNWVTLDAIQAAAADVSFFRTPKSTFFNNVAILITAKTQIDASLSPKRAPKPLGYFFPYWEMRTTNTREFRLGAPFFKYQK